jgi:hypothetical protein
VPVMLKSSVAMAAVVDELMLMRDVRRSERMKQRES